MWRTLLVLVLGAFAAGFLAVPAGAMRDTEEGACPVAVPEGTVCGFLTVPERRDVVDPKMIKVGYALHRSGGSAPDPVVFTNGGPGATSIQLMSLLVEMVPEHDVVIMEQRGSRYSQPRLECPGVPAAVIANLEKTGPDDMTKAAKDCRARLKGVDLSGYRTGEIAADLKDLREELGFPEWNLFGLGYSSRAMLQAAALDPQGTRALVLDSYLPQNAAHYDGRIAALKSTMAALGVTTRLDDMIARLNRTPALVQATSPVDRRPLTLKLTGDDAAALLTEALANPRLAPIAPALVEGIAQGRTALLERLVDEVADGLTGNEWGQYYAVQCQDEAPENSFADRRLFTVGGDASVCASWELPNGFAGYFTTNAPVLVLAGQYDTTTPAAKAKEAAARLPRGRFVEFAGQSHAVFQSSACARETITAFLDDPDAATPCDPGASAVAIAKPDKLNFTPTGYLISNSPVLLAPLGLFLALSALQLAGGLVTVRRGGLLSGLAGLLGVAFGALVWLSLSRLEQPAVLTVGLPSEIIWYGPLVAGATLLSITAAFRLNARAVLVLPALVGIVVTTWFYGFLL